MKKLSKLAITLLFLVLTYGILTHSQLSLAYALTGLTLWYEKMVPALLPFMILSGIMVRLHLTEGFTTLLYPFLRPLFRVSRNVCYAIILGFLCGFPMGAKTVADLYERDMITRREAEYLLAFCNNIGPVYFLSFVLPLLERRLILPYLAGMYGLPLAYGILLRYTKYRDLGVRRATSGGMSPQKATLLTELDEAIASSGRSILMLGGYMILFNLLNLLPHILLGAPPKLLAPLLEISGGLKLIGSSYPLYALLALPFGGLSCIAQTYSCISKTPLSIADYTFHKLILTALTGLYYLIWWLSSPSSFLR
ncbi:MAG: hypothetical protein NC417_05380 [Candidatus Gastranaerophilales bacterium]|nr:hypothetical protein [Candidatus Gastranaerophilales bacterium]